MAELRETKTYTLTLSAEERDQLAALARWVVTQEGDSPDGTARWLSETLPPVAEYRADPLRAPQVGDQVMTTDPRPYSEHRNNLVGVLATIDSRDPELPYRVIAEDGGSYWVPGVQVISRG